MFKVSIKTNTLMIFLTLVAVISSALLYSQYYFSKKIAIESTNRSFHMISENISDHLRKKAEVTRNILMTKSKDETLLETITFDPFHPALKGLVEILEVTQEIYALYFAHKDGHFYEVINMHQNPTLFEAFHAPDMTKWTVITIIENRQQFTFLDETLNVIDTRQNVKTYDPRQRIWYKNALKTGGISHTPAYRFSNLGKFGVTHSIQIDEKGSVLALDYTMEQLNQMLHLQKFEESAEIFLVNLSGVIVASSSFYKRDGENIKAHHVDQVLMKALKDKRSDQIIRYKDGTNQYYAMLKPLLFKTGYLGVKVDSKVLFQPYIDNFIISLSIAFILLFLAIPFIIWSINRMIRPIGALILENEKIKSRQFDDVSLIDTHIIEFNELSNSQVTMSKSIQSYQKSQEEILDAIIKLIADAIDAKSAYTAGHCKRVPIIAELLLKEANKSNSEPFKSFSFTSEDQLRAFQIGAWLHDCGKVTTPEYVVDKATKLETIYNRIHEIRMRFEVLWRDAHIDYLSKTITKEELNRRQYQLQDDFAFIASVNIGGEFLAASDKERIEQIAKIEWQRHFDDRLGLGEAEKQRFSTSHLQQDLPVTEYLLDDKASHIIPRMNFDQENYERSGFTLEVPEHLYNYGEVYNLCIEKGTLTEEERYKINEHVIMSIKMLEKIPFPRELSHVVEYAGTHHETLIGTGYPRKLSKDDLSIPARVMAIADIFEALTASDRPYKKAKTLSESIEIMSSMVQEQHIDEDLFKLFLRSGIYATYAKEHLDPDQIDEVNIEEYLV